MSRDTYWLNDDGLSVGFGTRIAENQRSGVTSVTGNKAELVLTFNYDDLPGGTDVSSDGSYGTIPAGAVITDSYVQATTDFAGGTSYDIGLQQLDGSTAINVDGLFDAVTLAQINAGDSARGHGGTDSGALLDSALAAEAQVVASATGSFTAGTAKLVIEYTLVA